MIQQPPKIVERRRDVRVRPALDYDVKAELAVNGLATPLSVLDISVGGIGVLVSHALSAFKVGDEVTLSVAVHGGAPFIVKANLRHIGPPGFGVCGLLFLDLSEEARTIIRHCVSDLLARGQHF